MISSRSELVGNRWRCCSRMSYMMDIGKHLKTNLPPQDHSIIRKTNGKEWSGNGSYDPIQSSSSSSSIWRRSRKVLDQVNEYQKGSTDFRTPQKENLDLSSFCEKQEHVKRGTRGSQSYYKKWSLEPASLWLFFFFFQSRVLTRVIMEILSFT